MDSCETVVASEACDIQLPIVTVTDTELIVSEEETARAVASISDVGDNTSRCATVGPFGCESVSNQSKTSAYVELEPSFSPNIQLDDPTALLDMITNGKIDIIATANDDGVAEIPASAAWNTDIDMLFSPQTGDTQVAEKAKKSRTITSHRLLTSASVIELKRKALEKKQEKITKANERKVKRELKKIKANQ